MYADETTSEENCLINLKFTNDEKEYDTGIRYAGSNPNNYVYFNCADKDSDSIGYGKENYDYTSSCEIWRIIGVFDVDDGDGNIEKRIKIINTASTFKASWDSNSNGINGGYGINQLGESTMIDGSLYAGADLMQLLNGYYIEKNDSTIAASDKKECKYNNGGGQSGFAQTCDTTDTPLSSFKMKPLTSLVLSMIDDAVWYTYATNTDITLTAYLQERGISEKYTGCANTETIECTEDNVTRNNEWTGLVGLMSLSDIRYANGWLYKSSEPYPHTITSISYSS